MDIKIQSVFRKSNKIYIKVRKVSKVFEILDIQKIINSNNKELEPLIDILKSK